jgi:calcineurin-like phosphoesterase family protein
MKEPRKFIIADTHFGHKNIITESFEKASRPFNTIAEHDEELIRRWNDVVKTKDTVWHLGDVLFGEGSFTILSRLNGFKKLVLGNHDHYPMERYREHFSQVYGAASMSGMILTHVPVHPDQLKYRFKGNIHGHLHSHVVDDSRYYNVSCEQINLTPILVDKVLAEMKTRLTN